MTQTVNARYLGFTLAIGDHDIAVRYGGRLLDRFESMSRARAFCRGYRRADRNERKAA